MPLQPEPQDRAAAEELVRNTARAFIRLLHYLGDTDPGGDRMASAHLTLALRHIEDAEARALRHLGRFGGREEGVSPEPPAGRPL